MSSLLPSPADAERDHASALLQKVINEGAAMDYFTFGWLIRTMPSNSLGIIGLVLSLMSLLPVIDIPARFLIMAILGQIIIGHDSPVLPKRFLDKRFPGRYLNQLNRYAIPVLKQCEKIVRPRWTHFLFRARRLTALVTIVLTFLSLVLPIPFINVPPALTSALIALAYLENDGLLLFIALLSSITMLAMMIVIGMVAFH